MAQIQLKISSFNCCSLRKNIELIRRLTLLNYYFIFLQETFVVEDKLGILDYIDEQYECIGVGATLSEKSLVSMAGRPEGGLAVLWKKDSYFKIKEISLRNNFIFLNINIGNLNCVLVNVYLHSVSWDLTSVDNYLESLSELKDFMDSNVYDSIYFFGDFNADPFSGRAWQHLEDFCSQNSLRCYDFDLLDEDSYTFIGYGNSVSKWLDHFVGTENNNIVVEHVKILDGINGSDHLPMEIILNFLSFPDMLISQRGTDGDENNAFVNWAKLNSH